VIQVVETEKKTLRKTLDMDFEMKTRLLESLAPQWDQEKEKGRRKRE
jgi:hypothetical protein